MAEEVTHGDGLFAADGDSSLVDITSSEFEGPSILVSGSNIAGTGTGLNLDVTLVVTAPAAGEEVDQSGLPLFSLVSTNPEKAPTLEVPWSQLLALSLSPVSEPPVLTVGRHKECNVQLDDPRVSVRHFDIVARKRYDEDAEESELGSVTYTCILNDSSSNGTMVNGRTVGKGNSCHLHSGDEVCVLSAATVGNAEAISWVFRNTTEMLATTRTTAEAESKVVEYVLCPICFLVIYKCVALMPCLHNFCSACFSGWMSKCKGKPDCPVCRQTTVAVMKNHAMDEVIHALLEACPGKRRSEDERREMDARDRLKLGVDGRSVREFARTTAEASEAPAANVGGNAAARNETAAAPGGPERRSSTRSAQACVLH